MIISKKEKEKLVIQFATEGKTTKGITMVVHRSLKDVGKMIHMANGNDCPIEKEGE